MRNQRCLMITVMKRCSFINKQFEYACSESVANEKIQKAIESGMTQKEMSFISEIPEKKVPNYFFRSNGDLTFSDVTDIWSESEDSFSHGCAYVDLDNDGDLDVVVNNVNDEAYILENTQRIAIIHYPFHLKEIRVTNMVLERRLKLL